ncbi:ankyrin repeat-containing domain, PGG domain protein [Tanacetum coccineum]
MAELGVGATFLIGAISRHRTQRIYLQIGAPLYEASLKCDWKAAKDMLDENKEIGLVRYSITANGETALHVAASSKAAAGNTRVVKIMVERNSCLHTIPGSGGTMMPVYATALFGHYEVVKYLCDNSKGLSDDGWTTTNRGWLFKKCAENDMLLLSVCAFIGLKAGAPEKESEALPLLRIIWGDIVKLPQRDIDCILRGPPDSGHSGSKRFFQTLQLKNLIFEHLDKLDKEIHNTIQGPEQVLQLKNLVIKHVVNIHDETQRCIRENNTPEDQPRQMHEFISDYIVKIHDETQKSITREDQAQNLKDLIFNHINRMSYETNAQKTFSSRVMFIAAETGNTNFLLELIRQSSDLIWKVNDDNQTIFHVAVKYHHEDIDDV